MVDIGGFELDAADREILQHPLVGGVILFTRNYADKKQIAALCQQIRTACPQPVLIAVDQEGGRVQRFGEPFTRIPAMHCFGTYYDAEPENALLLTEETGRLLAAELRDVGIDFSFTPVLDLNWGESEVIGSRAFHRDPIIVAALAGKLVSGMRRSGAAAVGKHFPGHGFVNADSHLELPVDKRDISWISNEDIVAFKHLIINGLSAIMPAHIVYERADSKAAGFSHYWLQTVLREQLHFDGAVFSDDLQMAAASVAGDVIERASAAAAAGCDMLLLCNNRTAVEVLLSDFRDKYATAQRERRLQSMRGQANEGLELCQRADIQEKLEILSQNY